MGWTRKNKQHWIGLHTMAQLQQEGGNEEKLASSQEWLLACPALAQCSQLAHGCGCLPTPHRVRAAVAGSSGYKHHPSLGVIASLG